MYKKVGQVTKRFCQISALFLGACLEYELNSHLQKLTAELLLLYYVHFITYATNLIVYSIVSHVLGGDDFTPKLTVFQLFSSGSAFQAIF